MTETDLLNLSYSNIDEARQAMDSLLKERSRYLSLPRELYNDPLLFRVDMEEIFLKEWLFAGMTCEVPDPGCYMTIEIGQNPVLIVRDRDGEVRAFQDRKSVV